MTKPNRELLRYCFPTREGQMSSAPLGCGLLAAPVSISVYPANISHPGHFPPAFPYSLICFIEVCICLFSAAVPWTGGVRDAAVPGSAAEHGASEHSPCSASRGSWRSQRRQGGGCDGWQNPLHGSSLGVFALQMCTEIRRARRLPRTGAHKRCMTVRGRSGWCGGVPLLVQ